MLRLESLLRDRLEPRILGLRMVSVILSDGRRVLVIRVPKSRNPPHAVLQNKSRLIFGRNSAGVHETSVEEMRAMFSAGADFQQAIEFREKRMDIIHTGQGPFSNLPGDGRITLHIVPFSAFNSQSSIDLRRLVPSELIPIWCGGCDFGFNVDGYWTRTDTGSPRGYLQVFRNGIIETAAGDVRTTSNAGFYMLAQEIEDRIAKTVNECLLSLRRADVSLPAYVMVGGIRMSGTYIFFDPYASKTGAPPLPTRFEFPVAIIEDYSTIEAYRQSLKPLFDAVWNAAGYESSKSYARDGKWQRK